MDVQINNKKMWESLIWKVGEPLRQHIEKALREQGLTVNDNGEIVSIEPEPFFKQGNWYKCIDFIGLYGWEFERGCFYQCKYDNTLSTIKYGLCSFKEVDRSECMEHFRPATECEILKAKFDSPELPEIVKEQVREITEKPTVRWDSVNGTLTFYNLTKEQDEKLKSALIGEPNEKDGLTEFENRIKELFDTTDFAAKDVAKELLSIARKQIINDFDKNAMVDDFIVDRDGKEWEPCSSYEQGIIDTLNVIKGV